MTTLASAVNYKYYSMYPVFMPPGNIRDCLDSMSVRKGSSSSYIQESEKLNRLIETH